MENFAVGILGTGSYVPETILSNDDLEKKMDTSDEWISKMTGIKQRRIASNEQATSDLATIAAKKAIAQAQIKVEDIGMILVATITPDMAFPATACLVQEQIGANNAFAMDISAACSGFVYGLSLANDYVCNHKDKYVLVIGAEVMSRIVDPEDRSTVVLFGDGAGAAVVGATEDKGIVSFDLGSDGAGGTLLDMKAGGSRLPATLETVSQKMHYLKMNGKEVYKFAVQVMGESVVRALEKKGLYSEQLDCLIPHQANIRIIDGALKRLGLDENKVFVNIQNYGNMSGASIPVALDEAIRFQKVKKGDLLAMVGFGAGLTWGSCIVYL